MKKSPETRASGDYQNLCSSIFGARMKNVLVLVLALLLLTFGATIAYIENQRYARALDMYPSMKQESDQEHVECLSLAETGTHDLWHLFFAIRERLLSL
ncbi:hypothetical protein PH5382_01724 [Phaeobacter sp. CECT 5382]|nr:hypothetical protein PH5382_01724 [Phaeobacter sp. CECT 5382]